MLEESAGNRVHEDNALTVSPYSEVIQGPGYAPIPDDIVRNYTVEHESKHILRVGEPQAAHMYDMRPKARIYAGIPRFLLH